MPSNVSFKEHLLSLDNFSMPRVLENTDARYVLIVRLILLEPGTFQTHPEMGVGLRSRYRFRNDDDFLTSLGTDIKNQIEKYLPTLGISDVRLTMTGNILGILIDTVNGSYAVGYDGDTDSVDAAPTYILNDL